MNKYYESLIEKLNPSFEQYGFIFNKSTKTFKKSNDFGEYILEIGTLSQGIEIILSFGLKIPILDKILLKEVYGLSRTSSNLPTIWWHGTKVDNNYDNIRLFITNEKEVTHAKNKALYFFQNYALPYFKKFSKMSAVDHLLNDATNEFSSRTHSTEWNSSLYYGLITAKLLNRQDYSEVEKRNLEKIDRLHKDQIPDIMERFNKIDFDKYRNKLKMKEEMN